MLNQSTQFNVASCTSAKPCQSAFKYSITAIAPKIGCTPETLRVWYQKYLDKQNPVKVQQLSDQERIKQLERENKELQRANEILRKAAAFFVQAELC